MATEVIGNSYKVKIKYRVPLIGFQYSVEIKIPRRRIPEQSFTGGGAMNLVRRQFLRLGATALAALSLPSNAWPQTYPSRPVRLISAFPAGGPNDVLARLIGQGHSERL